MPPKRKASSVVEQDAKRVKSTSSKARSVDHQRHQNGSRAKPAAATMDQATTENQIMPPQRKAAAADKRYAKRVPSTRSRFRRIGHQKQQYKSRATSTAATMDQAPTDRKTQQVVQGPSASSSAKPELLYCRDPAKIYKDVDNYQRYQERRIMLIGKTGTGKSSLGNAILGCDCFETEGLQMQSNTSHCQVGRGKSSDGKDIVVLDTPGLMDTKRDKKKIIEELCKCTAIMAPGPHIICLVIRCDERFTQENIDTLNEFCAFFGEDIYKYVIVVFTHKACMGKNKTTDDCLSVLPSEFVCRFLKFGGKKIAIESRAEKKDLKGQINELFKLIEEIIIRNGAGYYSEEKFKVAEKAFRKRIPIIQQEVEKRFKERKKSLVDKYKQEAKRSKDREKELEKKLREEKDKSEKKLKEKYKKKVKSFEKELVKTRNKNKKTEEEYQRKMEDHYKELEQVLLAEVNRNRSRDREAVPESQGFGDVHRTMVMEGAGLAYDVITGGIGTVTRTIERWFRG